jgi:hypothetical protein
VHRFALHRIRETENKKRRGFAAAPFAFGMSKLLLEQLHRVDQRLQHAERERDADEAPGQYELQRRRAVLLVCICHRCSSLCAGRFAGGADVE